MLRIISDAMYIAANAELSHAAVFNNLNLTIADVFLDFMSVANTFM